MLIWVWLLCNDVSHWLGASPESALHLLPFFVAHPVASFTPYFRYVCRETPGILLQIYIYDLYGNSWLCCPRNGIYVYAEQAAAHADWFPVIYTGNRGIRSPDHRINISGVVSYGNSCVIRIKLEHMSLRFYFPCVFKIPHIFYC